MQQLGVSSHNGKQIVEVMRYAAGKLTDGFHLLGLVQRSFGPLTFLHFELQASIDRLQITCSVLDHPLDPAGITGTEQQ